MSVQELESFRSFVKRKPAFDVVVDGLNVANINQDKSRQSKTVGKRTPGPGRRTGRASHMQMQLQLHVG